MLPDLGDLAKEHAVTEPAGPSPANIIDMAVFGRYLRSLRMRQGFETGRDFVEVLRRDYGVDVSERTLYAIERGEQMPRLDFVARGARRAWTPISPTSTRPSAATSSDRLKENEG